jgi:hypothetical protein
MSRARRALSVAHASICRYVLYLDAVLSCFHCPSLSGRGVALIDRAESHSGSVRTMDVYLF